MAKVLVNAKYPTIFFNAAEHLSIKDYAELILAKKKSKGDIIDRITSEMGEIAVDSLLEKLNLDRQWMRGRFHYDFKNKSGSIRLEVKTRKMYVPIFDDLDVRLDSWEYNNATESTHIVPVVYDPDTDGARIITPGVLGFESFLEGITKHKSEIPHDFKLKYPCHRTTWGIVFKYPEDFGFVPWDEFIPEFKK